MFIVILVIIALGIAGYYYLTVLKAPEVAPEPNTPTSFIPTEHISVLRIAPNDAGGLLRSIELARDAQSPTGSLVYLPVRVDFTATSSAFLVGDEFTELLSLDTPINLSRTLQSQWGLYQMHNIGSVSSALLFSVNNPERAFAGLLDWEETIIDRFDPLFGIGEGATTSFNDVLIDNIDTRIATASTTSFAHGVFGGRIAIIASDEKMLREMLARLIAGPLRYNN